MDQYLEEIYKKLFGRSIYEAKLTFQQLKVVDSNTGDMFFSTFGVGNTLDLFTYPYERLICYEFLLSEIKKIDERKYYELHKGTPFYVMAWIAFDLEHYEKAMFYMDAAVAEDIDFVGNQWPSLPMGKMFTLTMGGAGDRTTKKIRDSLHRLFERYSTTVKDAVDFNLFTMNFVVPFVNRDIKNRSVVTALYSFVLEFESMKQLLSLRSDGGGTLEPILSHLFKGGLIFETLLKYIRDTHLFKSDLETDKKTKMKQPKGINTLGNFNYSSGFISRYCDFEITALNIQQLLNLNLNDMISNFGVTYKLRNETGHDLRKDDMFSVANYEKLFLHEIFAIIRILKIEFSL